LIFLHNSLGFLDVLIFEAVDGLPRHDFFHGDGLWISSIRDSSNHEIAVGNYSYEAVFVAHGENTYIKAAHLLGGFLDRSLRGDDFHVSRHNTI
jgi:hypothetical protein